MDQRWVSISKATTRSKTLKSSTSQRGGTVNGNSFRVIIEITSEMTICNSSTGREGPSKSNNSRCAICQHWLRDMRSGGRNGSTESNRGPICGKNVCMRNLRTRSTYSRVYRIRKGGQEVLLGLWRHARPGQLPHPKIRIQKSESRFDMVIHKDLQQTRSGQRKARYGTT